MLNHISAWITLFKQNKTKPILKFQQPSLAWKSNLIEPNLIIWTKMIEANLYTHKEELWNINPRWRRKFFDRKQQRYIDKKEVQEKDEESSHQRKTKLLGIKYKTIQSKNKQTL